MFQAGTSEYENSYRPLRRELAAQVGEEDANLLLSGVSVEGERLASLGPLVGLWQVANGELSREAYLQQYGHRGLHEFEVSWPRPAESPDWIDQQLETIAGMDIPALLARREGEKAAAWERYLQQFPNEAEKIGQKLQKTAAAARGREAIRSEVIRLLGAARHFALKAGELSGLQNGACFLSLGELLKVLEGNEAETAVAQIPTRQQAYERYSALPPYPALINGRFDPQRWAADPNRRSDIYDVHAETTPINPKEMDNVIQGLPGSAGVVEGIVRKLDSMDGAYSFQAGEILVAVTTNVGWTPLFPKAAAVVTDVGAPLSHAAIVARELGIPAVVGTGNATMHLQTGDRVRVNGMAGTVEKIVE
jgi:pyruvate,water dikinase